MEKQLNLIQKELKIGLGKISKKIKMLEITKNETLKRLKEKLASTLKKSPERQDIIIMLTNQIQCYEKAFQMQMEALNKLKNEYLNNLKDIEQNINDFKETKDNTDELSKTINDMRKKLNELQEKAIEKQQILKDLLNSLPKSKELLDILENCIPEELETEILGSEIFGTENFRRAISIESNEISRDEMSSKEDENLEEEVIDVLTLKKDVTDLKTQPDEDKIQTTQAQKEIIQDISVESKLENYEKGKEQNIREKEREQNVNEEEKEQNVSEEDEESVSLSGLSESDEEDSDIDTSCLNELGRILAKGLAEINTVRPADPINYLGNWLYSYVEMSEKISCEMDEDTQLNEIRKKSNK